MGGDLDYWRSEAERLRAENERLRAENARQAARITELEGQVAALSEKVAELTKALFGQSSEKTRPQPTPDNRDPGSAGGPDPGARRGRGQQPESRGHGRSDCSHLPTTEKIHDVAQGERVCPRCAAPYAPFGQETSEQIDWEVRLVRRVHIRRTYRRTCHCPVPGILSPPPVAKAIAKGRFTTGFLARLIVEKFVLGRPTHRIAAALAMEGLDVAEGTLAGVFASLADLLGPLAAMIKARNATSTHLHADETRWQVFAAVEGTDSHRWWLWVFLGVDTTVFTIAPSRSYQVLARHLGLDPETGQLPPGRTLSLSSDFYAVYQTLGGLDGVDNLWCWSHIRRYFIRAGDACPELASWSAAWCERIGALYVARKAMTAAVPESPRYSYAAAQFSAALGGIDAERRTQAARPGLHPRAAKVLATLDREWEGLARHNDFPSQDLDNNRAERALRTPVVGRKNFYGSGSVCSASLASAAWTITATAAQAGINPLTYLITYLEACASAGARAPQGEALARFAPWAASEADLAAWRDPPPSSASQSGPDP